MKKSPGLRLLICSVIMFVAMDGVVFCQDSAIPKVTGAFDSIEVKEIKATGNLTSGTVTITMQVHNRYATSALVHFQLGGEENFSIVDDKGTKYKIFTSENLLRAAGINKGFHNIASLHFGGQRSSSFMYARQELGPDESKLLSIQIDKVDKTVHTIKAFRIRCRRATGIKMDDETVYQIENIPVNWTTSKTKSK